MTYEDTAHDNMTHEDKEAERRSSMAEERTWQERVLQVFHDLDKEAKDKEAKGRQTHGSKWKDFLSERGFRFDSSAFDLPAMKGSGASRASEAKQAFDQPCQVNRNDAEFRDMPLEVNWIFPGRPSQSVLYHLLASADAAPHLPPPTQAQIETVENAVYAAQNFDRDGVYNYASTLLPDCKKDANQRPILRVVVFACEYRASSGTPHGLYADICYARTGVARVGTVSLPYEAELRSYPFTEVNDAFQIPTLPARYAAFVAASVGGTPPILGWYKQDGDQSLDFWVPVHKLFPGTDCLQGLRVELDYEACHVNEKLRRFHLLLGSLNLDTRWKPPVIDAPPFLITGGIAELESESDQGSQEVAPVAHSHLIARIPHQEGLLTYRVPVNQAGDGAIDVFSSSLEMKSGANVPGGAESHPAPELLHARQRLLEDGNIEDLNNRPNLIPLVKKGAYEALHFHDFTGDGWITVQARFLAFPDSSANPLPQSPFGSPDCLAAYSLVAAPDFLPKAGQRSVSDCLEAHLSPRLRSNIWYKPALSLADQRHAPNLALDDLPIGSGITKPKFAKTDVTMTAIVTAPHHPTPPPASPRPCRNRRSSLPDAAAGMFAPGWDVGLDSIGEGADQIFHMAMYSLGSPFLTDSKLCAALSAFWPAAAPDTARTYAPEGATEDAPKEKQATIVPLTDREIGLTGEPPWDGIVGPRLLPGTDIVDYPALAHADYVMQALPENRFHLKRLAEITPQEYVRRLLSMFRVYKALNVPVDQPCARLDLFRQKAAWTVLSYRPADPEDPLFIQAQASQPPLVPFFHPDETVDFYDVYQCEDVKRSPDDIRRRRATMKQEQGMPVRHQLFVGEKEILIRSHSRGAWSVAPKVAGL